MQSLITLFFERGSFGAFVICLLLFFLAVYLTYFRKKSPKLSQKKNKPSEKKINLMSRNTIIMFLLFMQVICFIYNKTAHEYVEDTANAQTNLIMASYLGLVAINFYLLINLFPLWKNYLKTKNIFFRSFFFLVNFFIAAMVTRFTELFFII